MGLHDPFLRLVVAFKAERVRHRAPLWKSRMERSHKLFYLYSAALKSRAAKPLIHAAVEALSVIAAGCS